MWWVVLVLLLLSRRGTGGTVTASVNVTPAATPNVAGNPWNAGVGSKLFPANFQLNATTSGVGSPTAFPGNPDTRPGAWPGLVAPAGKTYQNFDTGADWSNLFVSPGVYQWTNKKYGISYQGDAAGNRISDDPALNLSVGVAPPQAFEGGPAAAPSNPLTSLLQQAPPIAEVPLPLAVPIGDTVSSIVTLPTVNSTASFVQTTGVTAPRLGQL